MKKINPIVYLFFVLISGLIVSYIVIYKPFSQEIGDCIPTNFRSEKINDTYYVLWNTQKECIGYVKYGVKDNTFPYLAVDEQGTVKLQNHKIKMGGVDTKVDYYLVIFSEDKTYGKMGLPIKVQFN